MKREKKKQYKHKYPQCPFCKERLYVDMDMKLMDHPCLNVGGEEE